MTKASEFFDSKYLAAGDLGGKEHKLQITALGVAEFKDGRKPVIFFAGKKKGMSLNKTNANKLKAQYGDEMDNWIGKEVIIFPDVVDFQGVPTPCVRLRPVLPLAGGDGDFKDSEIPW